MQVNILDTLTVYEDVNNNQFLKRIGPNEDGGYVLPMPALTCSNLITLGVGKEYRFENDWLEIKPNNTVLMIDGTIDRCPLSMESNQCSHIIANVGCAPCDISIKHVINLCNNDTVLKIDIEGDEYNVFEELTCSKWSGDQSPFAIIVEFHDLNRTDSLDAISNIINNTLSDYKLVHLHANSYSEIFDLNYADVSIHGFPKVLELTLLKNKYNLQPTCCSYPRLGLDFSNNPNVKDIDLPWVNKHAN